MSAQNEWRMPPEWAPHRRTWMMWPCRSGLWPDIRATQRAYAALAHTIRRFEPVTMIAPAAGARRARDLLGSDVEVLEFPIDDSWARDAGPCFVTSADGRLGAVDYRFNAWGGKYERFDGDAAVGAFIAEAAGAELIPSNLVAEGGGVSVDGEGTILTTDSCFPNPNRNPAWSRDAIAAELERTLGGARTIWLPGDAEETETDGHVDGIAVFVAPGVVAAEAQGGPDNPRREVNEANLDALRAARDAKGRSLSVVEIPEAEDAEGWGEMFCRSYVNAYIVNGAVVAPAYETPSDCYAREVFSELFPDREIVMTPVRDIAGGGGGVHCVTQQEPMV